MSGPITSGSVASEQQSSTRVTGLPRFAGILLIVSGLWNVLAGISQILNDKIFVSTPQYVYYFDITIWGWVHVLMGALVLVAGIGVLKATAWGRMLGVALASASLLVNFAFLPHYPFWSMLVIALDVLIIWQLASQAWGKD